MDKTEKTWDTNQIERFVANANQYCDEHLKTVRERTKNETGHVQYFAPTPPTINDFLLRYGYSNYIYDLEKKYPEVSEAFNRVRRTIVRWCETYASLNLANSTIAKMTLINMTPKLGDAWTGDRTEVRQETSHELHVNVKQLSTSDIINRLTMDTQ